MSNNSQQAPYRIIGAEESPYSVKVRACCQYKNLPYEWLNRSEAVELYQRHAKLPLIPLVVTPASDEGTSGAQDEVGLQDSTPIIHELERRHPEPSVFPTEPMSAFVDALLEEFADEWGNKWMFHYRWAREADQLACSKRLAKLVEPNAAHDALEKIASDIRNRMVDRVWFVGSSAQTAQIIETSFKDFLELLEIHLSARPYLFGARPASADFALWGQLYNCHRDPTPNEILTLRAPNTVAWIERMQQPKATGEFEAWTALAPTLTPLLKDQVVGMFLPWSQANATAIAQGETEFSVQLAAGMWTQKPQKYHARSLQTLADTYAEQDAEVQDAMKTLGVAIHLL